MHVLKSVLIGAAALLTMALPAGAQQAYPSRAMTMVVPFAAGGPTDLLARIVAERMSHSLGQQIVVENVGGAGGMTGGVRVARAAPDGYTMIVGTVGTHAQNQSLYAKPAYNAVDDFTPVALIADVPLVLIVKKDLPVDNLQQFIAYAKTNQKTMTYGTSGIGAAVHLGTILLNMAIGIEVAHVPFRGSAPAMNELVGGRIDYITDVISTAKTQVEGKTVKALAVLQLNRSPVLPDLPTADEQGLKGLAAYTWNAIFLPKGAPDDIVKKLNEAVVKAYNDPEAKKKLEGYGYTVSTPDRATPAYLGNFVKAEIEKWAVPIKAAGVRIE
jgi:tripartite-type tricarboxylate transporter receptor subunit TctC